MTKGELIDAWVNGVIAMATLVAVVVAIWSARREAQARDRAERRADAAEEAREVERWRADEERAATAAADRWERHRAQALQVISWLDQQPARSQTDAGGPFATDWVNTVRVANRSASPIFEVVIDVFDERMNTIAASNVRRFAVMVGRDDRELTLDVVPEDASILLRFRDLQGTWWRRFQNGHLEETHPNGIPLPAPSETPLAETQP
ncbi:MAG TPA: hypothetical protein VGK17_17235 [Propionicimonas sp.]